MPPTHKNPRPRGTPGRNSPAAVKRLASLLGQAPSQRAARAFVRLVTPPIQGCIKVVPSLASLTLKVAAAKDKRNKHLALRLGRNPDSDDLSVIANHLTLWLRDIAKAPNATVVINRKREPAGSDVFLVCINLTGDQP